MNWRGSGRTKTRTVREKLGGGKACSHRHLEAIGDLLVMRLLNGHFGKAFCSKDFASQIILHQTKLQEYPAIHGSQPGTHHKSKSRWFTAFKNIQELFSPPAMVFPILGTMNFGSEGQVKMQAAQGFLSSFAGSSCAKTPCGAMIDTARIYNHSFPEGDTETTLGQIFQTLPSLQKRCHLATKASPQWSLSKASVIEQCNTSLEKLGIDCVDLFYLHAPDIRTDINDTLEGIDQLHKEGKIKEFGLSNYPAWAVVDIWHRCKSRGMILPTVYQGAYNVITRDMEREIVPVARHFGLRLYMYNPLAGGLLSGRYSKIEDVMNATSGRFSAEFDSAFGKSFKAGTVIYRKRYAKEPAFEALEILMSAAPKESTQPGEVVHDKTTVVDGQKVRVVVSETKEPTRAGPTLAEVALRWLIHHSYLRKGDGIIIGASKQEHLVANLAAWQAGPLPTPLLEACEAAWTVSRSCCESYFRGYGALPGGIEAFLSLQDESEPVQKKSKVNESQTEKSSWWSFGACLAAWWLPQANESPRLTVSRV